jgi:hypothetical protein
LQGRGTGPAQIEIVASKNLTARPRPTSDVDAFGRPRISARAGLAFDYQTPDTALAVVEMLAAIGFE